MEKQKLTNTLSYGHAYHLLPIAHTFIVEDELYIKNLICHHFAMERFEAGDGSGWKESADILEQHIEQRQAEMAASW
jgi:hypothetical protein